MRRVHPLWRGFWLACVYTAALVLLDGTDWLGPYRGEGTSVALALCVLAGAFLASLPGILRCRKEGRIRPDRAQLLLCLLAGLAMPPACAMAGTGLILPALFTGSSGAYAFLGAAGLAGFVTARIVGKGARA